MAVPSDRIFLEDVRFHGHHGVTGPEQAVGTWFSVDIEMAMDLASAAASDDLRATVDYGAVAARIVEIGTGQRVNLLERLAGVFAQAILADFPCEEVRVRVRKLGAPLGGVTATPGVEITRRRR